MRVFARAVTYTAPGGEPVERRGVFDREHEIIKTAADGSDYSTVMPVLGIRFADWAEAPKQGGTIQIGSETFRITDPQPDGQGGANLILRKQI